MIGILVQLALSWLLAWLIEKKDLRILGLSPTKRRVASFLMFFVITALCCASGFLMRMYFGERWEVNPVLTGKLVLAGLWWHVKSVLFEELIFRGVLLYILIKRLGMLKGIIISAIAFGIYHWFSHEVIGDIKQMAITFLITGIFGLVYAYGYAKTFSLYIPCAIHLGWNFTHGFIFPEGPIGDGILVAAKPIRTVNVSYFTYYVIVWFPLVSAFIINFLLIRKQKQVEPAT